MPRYAVHSSPAPTPAPKIRPASASIALDRTSVVVIVITLSLIVAGPRHRGVSSGLALSDPPADGFFRLVAAQPARADRVAQVPGEGVVLRGDGIDRGPDAHRDRLAGTFGGVAGEPGPAAEAERVGELGGEHRTLSPQPLYVADIGVVLCLRQLAFQVGEPLLVGTAGGGVQNRPETAAGRCGRRPARGLDQLKRGYGLARTGEQDSQIADAFAVRHDTAATTPLRQPHLPGTPQQADAVGWPWQFRSSSRLGDRQGVQTGAQRGSARLLVSVPRRRQVPGRLARLAQIGGEPAKLLSHHA